ncbi:hypothetical protein MLD38_010229 [Melastoma candidum]|uniref:Uncharacterized protein n=2 Tax=Melastoma candidum TaxID=119954 RepID=A0ACB9QZ83_9MYRT|nr:hypothetical protein MLD38_010229 [Melastoma candidum]
MLTSMDLSQGERELLPPLMMLPPTHPGNSSCSFFSLQLSRRFSFSHRLPDGRCVGSSRGYLLLLDHQCNPFLLNPFDATRLALPPLDTFPCILGTYFSRDGTLHAHYRTRSLGRFDHTSLVPVENLREFFIHKAIVATSSPLPGGSTDFFVVAICGDDSRLVYARPADSSWNEIPEGGRRRSYHDVICRSGTIFALSSEGFVRAWDVKARVPLILMDIECSFPKRSVEFLKSMGELYSNHNYLVETDGTLLLVVRLIGEFVNGNNEPVTEADLLIDTDTHPLVCPYRTLQFHVYILDKESQDWVAVDHIGIGGQALFIGGSESTSVSAAKFPGCERGSIYFTDDYWERVDEDYLYGGHDIGVYNIGSGRISQLCELGSDKIEPPPFWVTQSWEQHQHLSSLL